MTKNLTKGSPFKLMLFFMLPVVIGNVFQQLYNMADAVIVGRAISPDAMAGVSNTGSITFLVMGFALGLTSGFAVKTSQRFGAGDDAGVRKSVATSLQLCIVLAVLLMGIATPLTGKILEWMHTPEAQYEYAYWYLFICFGGIGAVILYNIAAATLRAIGDTKTPLVILIVSAVLNIGLNLLFIFVFRMYHTGVAVATVISQFVSGLGGLIYMLKRYPVLRPSRADWKIDFRLWGGHIAIGLPMALQFSITAVGCMIQQAAVNKLDGLNGEMVGVSTAYAASCKINGLICTVFEAMGVTVATFSGQNYGANEFGRIRDGVFTGVVYSLVLWVFGVAVCGFFGKPLTAIFIDSSAEGVSAHYADMLAYSEKYLIYQSVFYPLIAIIYIYRNALQGIGRSALTMIGGAVEVVGRAMACFLFVKFWGFTGICLSNATAWLAADILFLICYYRVMRKYPAERNYGLKRFLKRFKEKNA